VGELLDAHPAVTDRVTTAPSGPLVPSVRFEDVRFRYAPELPEALRGVSFGVGEGETVALVGHSGAGKSTCVNLLLRLWDPTAGTIRVGGHDLRDVPQEALCRWIAPVPQDVHLFNATVRDNLLIGRADAADNDLLRVAELAQAREFIEALPDGLDTVLGERGAALSGGQRQRLAITRALLADRPILVMDEAVSDLDAESEAALRRALAGLRGARTLLIIAHRPSTIRTADRVVVLEEGRVVEQGGFEDLLESGGGLTALLRSG
jgi:ATP-binding cassette subfamily B protein/ATP-binding cassette subfamily C protein